jgi:hypothetical protein
MIYCNKKEIAEIYYGKVPLTELYYGKFLIWSAIRSCFGQGGWYNDKPWLNTDVWRN